ncbi:MAG: thioesterase family protein [Pseudomonadota bacterium]
MPLLDDEIRLSPTADPAVLTTPISGVYLNFARVAFGGWTMATALSALERHPEWRGAVLTANACFLEGLIDCDAQVRRTLLSRKKRTDFWRVEIFAGEGGPLAFSVDVVASLARTSEEDLQTPPPDAPPFTAIEPLTAPKGPGWMGTFELRPIKGKPFEVNDDPETLLWIRFADGRPIDAKGLAALCDTPLPRIFMVSPHLRIVSTCSLTLTYCADAAAMARAGSDPVLIQTTTDRIAESRFHQRARLWSASGDLLALSEQVAIYSKPAPS